MSNSIRAIIFDMGGVILRTDNQAIREAMARRLGTTCAELEEIVFQSPTSIQAELGEISDVDHWAFVADHYRQPVENCMDLYSEFFSGDEIDLELIGYIKALKTNYKIGLLSNAWTHARQNLTRLQPYLDLFDVSIFSCEVNLRKPDARIFDLILKRLDVKAGEAVFVDDFKCNIEGAKSAGLHAVSFPR